MKINKLIIFSIICLFMAFIVKTVVEKNTDCCSLPSYGNESVKNSGIINTKEALKIEDMTSVKIKVGYEVFISKTLNTPESRTLGLSGTKYMGKKNGRLFIFPKTQRHVFWMKDMNFNIDIIWIKDDKVVDITRDVSMPDPSDSLNELPRITPSVPVNVVLEVLAGSGDNISVGDLVEIDRDLEPKF